MKKDMIDHDQWSKLGEENLGGFDGPNISFMMNGTMIVNQGPFTLMKCILNDYWADVSNTEDWTAEKVDVVMSKLYYCWVAMFQHEVDTIHKPREEE
jgi:homoserine trans-succinylase